jgi:dTDP-4-amino-4,6-dideoxy-D-glucose ammonia-lyase
VSTTVNFALDHDFLTMLEERLVVPDEVAVVGGGRWGKVVCRVLATFSPPVSKILFVAERNFRAVQQWRDERVSEGSAEYERVHVSASLGDVLDADRVRVAFVTRMASAHYETTRQLLEAGVHVLVEKPFVLKSTQARELVALARSRRLTLAVGYEFMFARTLHHFRELLLQHLPDVSELRITWEDAKDSVKYGVRKEPDLTANVVTDLYPHILSQLLILLGDGEVRLLQVASRNGCSEATLSLQYGSVPVTVLLDKSARQDRREIVVTSSSGRRLVLDFTTEPGAVTLDGRSLAADALSHAFPASVTAAVAYFFAAIRNATLTLPNDAEQTMHFVEATERADAQLTSRQMEDVRPLFWDDPPSAVPEHALRVLRHHTLDGLLRHRLLDNPKDIAALDGWAARAFRIAHRFSRDPWTEQTSVLLDENIAVEQLIRLNAVIRESDFLQQLMVQEGVARQYWSTILPLIETNSISAVLSNSYQFPLRLGIYAAVSCMFSCTFCGRMENPSARYAHGDVAPGNELFDQVFAAMPAGISTLSLGGGLEPLTNPDLDAVIRSAKHHGHKVPLVTNGYMLTPLYVKRHEGLWDLDILRISLYGVDEASYCHVTQKRGAFAIVKNNVIEFLKERRRRQHGPRVGFNFIVLINTTHEVLRLLDLIAEINDAVGAEAIDFLTLREDFSRREGDGLTLDERRSLVGIFDEFHRRRARMCPSLSVDFGYALYPLAKGTMWQGLAMVGHDRMLPKAYPQISVAIDLLGDVYLYRDAAFPNRPGADRYKIGTISKTRSLEAVVRAFLENGADIVPRPNDPWLMDAFDHVVTNLIWQAQADERAGIPFSQGPVRRRADTPQPTAPGTSPVPVNYWQGLFGA